MGTFEMKGSQFVRNGEPFRILSGAIHYFRVMPEYWQDRLEKLRAMGLNTVETYVPWNLHEARPGRFDFSGRLDIARFIRTAGDLGLQVIVRPGPYICAEWDLGGLPAWLLEDPHMKLRCAHPAYLAAAGRFFDALLPHVAPLQITRGGPVIMVQVENEYGSYANDKTYLSEIEQMLRSRGIDVMLFTSDGPSDPYIQCGTLPHIYKTVNFGTQAAEALAYLKEVQPEAPLMCTEYWNGWFDHWGEAHHVRTPDYVASMLDEILSAGASVNLYMFHGGTNFGLTSGANELPEPIYQATVTSYDYDAPLSEAGDPTPKYFAMREVILRHTGSEPLPVPPALPKMALGPVTLKESAGLFENLSALAAPVTRAMPEPMEILGYNTAFILYRTRVNEPTGKGDLVIEDVHDRAMIFMDGTLVGVMERELKQDTLAVDIPEGGAQLDILVENMGRVNYGPHMVDRKGILHGVRIGQRFLTGWEIYPLLAEELPQLTYQPAGAFAGPTFYRGSFQVDSPNDTFLALPGWTKGLCWVNGFCLGRYWSRGPQQALYVPAPLMRSGVNEVVVFELHGLEQPVVEFRAEPDLGELAS